MRISQLVSVPNWRYAVGEIILIVVGVTIALAATSWYEGRQVRRDELLILEQLHQTLSEDLQKINTQWEKTRERERRITALLDYIESDRPYTEELARDFESLFGWWIVRIKTAPFEALKVQGFSLISNVVLREQLIAFYQDHYAKLEYNSNLDRDFAIEKIQPYFFENFLRTESHQWLPKNYEQIKAGAYIANLCRFRAHILRTFVLRDYENTTAVMREILDLIEQELAGAS